MLAIGHLEDHSAPSSLESKPSAELQLDLGTLLTAHQSNSKRKNVMLLVAGQLEPKWPDHATSSLSCRKACSFSFTN